MKRITVTKDTVDKVFASLKNLVGSQVLVGIPDSTTSRQEEIGQPITNATLAYIHENGSPAANIPARPFLIPGVEKAEQKALAQLLKAADAAIDGKDADPFLNAAGIIAVNSARNEIQTGNFVPLAPSTIRNRHRSRGAKSMRKSEQQYLDLIDAGSTREAAQAQTGIRPLINTGALRNAITYVIRKNSGR